MTEHAEWLKGHDSAVFGMVRLVRNALNGKDDGTGICTDPSVERLRRQILKQLGMKSLLTTAVDAMDTNGIQCGLSEAWLIEAKKMVGWDDD